MVPPNWRILVAQSQFGINMSDVRLKTDANNSKNEGNIVKREPGKAPVLEETVYKAIRMLKNGKSPGVDSLPRF